MSQVLVLLVGLDFVAYCAALLQITLVLQYVLGTGSSDIDDVWLNTAGGCLGYLLFLAVTKLAPKRVTALSTALVLSLCFAVGGYAVAYREFGLYLGPATIKDEVRGGEQIPGRPAARVTDERVFAEVAGKAVEKCPVVFLLVHLIVEEFMVSPGG